MAEVTTGLADLGSFMQPKALRELLRIIFQEIKDNTLATLEEIPMDVATEEEFPESEKMKVPTAFAVYKAIKKINHVYLRFIKSEGGKTFKEMMAAETPQELCFYVFKDSSSDNQFDLYFYDSQQGDYVNVGSTDLSGMQVDLSGYWSKEELKIEDILSGYWSKEELKIEDLVKVGDLDLSQYIRRDEIGTITADDVNTMWNEIKNGSAS